MGNYYVLISFNGGGQLLRGPFADHNSASVFVDTQKLADQRSFQAWLDAGSPGSFETCTYKVIQASTVTDSRV